MTQYKVRYRNLPRKIAASSNFVRHYFCENVIARELEWLARHVAFASSPVRRSRILPLQINLDFRAKRIAKPVARKKILKLYNSLIRYFNDSQDTRKSLMCRLYVPMNMTSAGRRPTNLRRISTDG